MQPDNAMPKAPTNAQPEPAVTSTSTATTSSVLRKSVLNPGMYVTSDEWVVALINTGGLLLGHSRILVEGLSVDPITKKLKHFFGQYDISVCTDKDILNPERPESLSANLAFYFKNEAGYLLINIMDSSKGHFPYIEDKTNAYCKALRRKNKISTHLVGKNQVLALIKAIEYDFKSYYKIYVNRLLKIMHELDELAETDEKYVTLNNAKTVYHALISLYEDSVNLPDNEKKAFFKSAIMMDESYLSEMDEYGGMAREGKVNCRIWCEKKLEVIGIAPQQYIIDKVTGGFLPSKAVESPNKDPGCTLL